jgi:hypothetical protein
MSEIEQMNQEPRVIPNSDFLHAKKMVMVEDTPYIEPNEYEKSLLKGTMTPTELLEKEKEEIKPVSDNDKVYLARRDYIAKVKVIGLHRIGKHPLYNGSLLKRSEKERLKLTMEKIMMLTDDQIQREFNDICIDILFDENTDYSTFPVYDPLTMRTEKSNYDNKVITDDGELNRNYN